MQPWPHIAIGVLKESKYENGRPLIEAAHGFRVEQTQLYSVGMGEIVDAEDA